MACHVLCGAELRHFRPRDNSEPSTRATRGPAGTTTPTRPEAALDIVVFFLDGGSICGTREAVDALTQKV